MTPQSYATSLIYRGHTPQSVKLATGCDVHVRKIRNEFRPSLLNLPAVAPPEPYGPPVFTRGEKIRATINAVALKHGLTRDELMNRSHLRRYSWPRQEVYFILHRKYGLSLPRTGEIMGRDHATVLHGVRKHEARNAL